MTSLNVLGLSSDVKFEVVLLVWLVNINRVPGTAKKVFPTREGRYQGEINVSRVTGRNSHMQMFHVRDHAFLRELFRLFFCLRFHDAKFSRVRGRIASEVRRLRQNN